MQAQKTGEDYTVFLYDENGAPYGMINNGELYYYALNVQGDVVSIVDIGGTEIVKYRYNAWGETVSIKGTGANTIGLFNPIRYRSYYFDAETGFYYLQSRYYDPEIYRFINADSQLNNDIIGCNLFSYCGNNPANRTDDNGQGWWIFAGAAIGGIAGGITKVISNAIDGKKWNEGIIGAVIGGAVSGGILAATGSITAAGFVGAAVESVLNEVLSYIPTISKYNGNSSTQKLSKENILNSTKNAILDTAVNGTISVATGKIASKIVPINKAWIKPQKFISSFAGRYAIKSNLQTVAQSSLIFGINCTKSAISYRLNQGQQPIITFFPDTFIQTAG